MCDQIGTNGCIASGLCPVLAFAGCMRGKLSMQVASVSVVRPAEDNIFVTHTAVALARQAAVRFHSERFMKRLSSAG